MLGDLPHLAVHKGRQVLEVLRIFASADAVHPTKDLNLGIGWRHGVVVRSSLPPGQQVTSCQGFGEGHYIPHCQEVQSGPSPAMTTYPLLRRFLFRLDPEAGHAAGMAALRAAQALPPVRGALVRRNLVDDPRLRQTLFGREVPNPVGLAAGLDKDAAAVRGMAALGFGFLEVGTVTPLAQPGNPRPRLFRFPAAESLQNAMGFNNGGMDAMRRRL